jgi:catechol 2,3-dioxygenase-like lactoylglutathione lyase family enzyme
MRLTDVELYSKDLARSRAFYRDVLGLEMSEDQPTHHIMFEQRDAFLCLEVPGAENYPSIDKAVLFFEVRDLATTADRIGRDRFVKLELESPKPWAVLHDPD